MSAYDEKVFFRLFDARRLHGVDWHKRRSGGGRRARSASGQERSTDELFDGEKLEYSKDILGALATGHHELAEVTLPLADGSAFQGRGGHRENRKTSPALKGRLSQRESNSPSLDWPLLSSNAVQVLVFVIHVFCIACT